MKRFGIRSEKKNIFSTVVALVLVAMLVVGVSYSWIEDVKLVQITTAENAENTPLKAGVDINSDVTIDKSTTEINLGNMLTNSDLLQDGSVKTGYSPNVSGDTLPATVNAKKGFFYESGDMHFSPCYSDGVSFFFPVMGTNGQQVSGTGNNATYRLGNKNDENVNYIDFTFNVTSPDANAAFWFREVPTIRPAGNNSDLVSNARYAITVDGNTKVFSVAGDNVNTVSGVTATETMAVAAEKLSKYTYGNSNNNSPDAGQNGYTLFTIPKGKTKTVNIKIWTEGDVSQTVSASDINLAIISSLGKERDISLLDRTTGVDSASWLRGGSTEATMYLVIPQAYVDNGNQWISGKSFWEFAYDSSKPVEERYTKVSIPAYYNNSDMFIFRCNKNGFLDTGIDRQLPYTTDSNYAKIDGIMPRVRSWNYWTSTLPDSYHDETYTIYAGTLDDNAVDRIGRIGITLAKTYKGYGTWGDTMLVKVQNAAGSNCARFSHRGGVYANFFIFDYSDKAKTGEIYRYTLYSTTQTDNSYGIWQSYMPVSSTKLQFYYNWKYGNEDYKDLWGFNTSTSGAMLDTDTGQERPDGSDGTTASDTYYLNGRAGNGYWHGAEGPVYLVNYNKSGTPKAYAWLEADESVHNAAWPGVAMTNTNESFGGYNIYTYTVASSYDKIQFNDGTNNNKQDTYVNIGRYFNWLDGKWYDSLDSISGGGGGGSSSLSDSMSGTGYYLYGSLDDTSGQNKYLKLSSSGGNYEGTLYLAKTSGFHRNFKIVHRKTDGTTLYYGAGSGSYRVLNGSSTNVNFNFQSGGDVLGLQVNTAATYKFTYNTSSHNIVISGTSS